MHGGINMRVFRVYYLDDGKKIQGLLIRRFMRTPVFYPSSNACGFSSQKIRVQDIDKKCTVC